MNDESLKAYLAPTGLVSEPRGDLTFRGDRGLVSEPRGDLNKSALYSVLKNYVFTYSFSSFKTLKGYR